MNCRSSSWTIELVRFLLIASLGCALGCGPGATHAPSSTSTLVYSTEGKKILDKFERQFPQHRTAVFQQLCDEVEIMHSKGDVADDEYRALHTVCGQARNGQWDIASRNLKNLVGADSGQSPIPNSAPNAAGKYHLKGSVRKSSEGPSAAEMVALLFDGKMHTQFLQARNAIKAPQSSTNPWPYDKFQNLVAGLQTEEWVSGATTNADGAFEFNKPLTPGYYLITVGIPTTRVIGVQLPKVSSLPLRGTTALSVGGHEIAVAGRSAWFAEVKVVDGDLAIGLDGDNRITWPEARPDPRKIQERMREIATQENNVDKAARDRDATEKKARQSHMPEDARKFVAADNKVTSAKEACDAAIGELDEMLRALDSEAQKP